MIELLYVPAALGCLFGGWALVDAGRQAYSKIVYGKYLAHPLAEKTILLQALLDGKEQELTVLKEKLDQQEAQMQEVYETLLTKIKGM